MIAIHCPVLFLFLEQSVVALEIILTVFSSIILQEAAFEGAPGPAIVIAFAIVLALVHVFAGEMWFFDRISRSHWLSFGSGISVAYVFVHLLPELEAGGEAIEQSQLVTIFTERHVYLIALTGFVIFYELERLVTRSSKRGEAETPSKKVFWIHVGSFTIYNALIGYLLHNRDGVVATVLFTVAMAVHFIVNDYGLREDHKGLYHSTGRWIISTAIIIGAVLGFFFSFTEALIAVLVAFLSGGIILNTIKEELPKERESRVWAFGAGVIFYTAVLLTI